MSDRKIFERKRDGGEAWQPVTWTTLDRALSRHGISDIEGEWHELRTLCMGANVLLDGFIYRIRRTREKD